MSALVPNSRRLRYFRHVFFFYSRPAAVVADTGLLRIQQDRRRRHARRLGSPAHRQHARNHAHDRLAHHHHARDVASPQPFTITLEDVNTGNNARMSAAAMTARGPAGIQPDSVLQSLIDAANSASSSLAAATSAQTPTRSSHRHPLPPPNSSSKPVASPSGTTGSVHGSDPPPRMPLKTTTKSKHKPTTHKVKHHPPPKQTGSGSKTTTKDVIGAGSSAGNTTSKVAATSNVVRICAASGPVAPTLAAVLHTKVTNGTTTDLKGIGQSSLGASSTKVADGRTTIYDYGCWTTLSTLSSGSVQSAPSSSSPPSSSSSSSSAIPAGIGSASGSSINDDTAFFSTSGGRGVIAGISVGAAAALSALIFFFFVWRRKRSLSSSDGDTGTAGFGSRGRGPIFLGLGRRNTSRSSVSSFGSTTSLPGQPYRDADSNGTRENLSNFALSGAGALGRSEMSQMVQRSNPERSFYVESRRYEDFPYSSNNFAGLGSTIRAGAFAGYRGAANQNIDDSAYTEHAVNPFEDPSSSGHETHETGHSGAALSAGAANTQRRRSGYMSDAYRSTRRASRPVRLASLLFWTSDSALSYNLCSFPKYRKPCRLIVIFPYLQLSVRNPDSDEAVEHDIAEVVNQGHEAQATAAVEVPGAPGFTLVPPSPPHTMAISGINNDNQWQAWSHPASFSTSNHHGHLSHSSNGPSLPPSISPPTAALFPYYAGPASPEPNAATTGQHPNTPISPRSRAVSSSSASNDRAQQQFLNNSLGASGSSDRSQKLSSSSVLQGRDTPESTSSSFAWHAHQMQMQQHAGRGSDSLDVPSSLPWINEGYHTPQEIHDVQLGSLAGGSAGSGLAQGGGRLKLANHDHPDDQHGSDPTDSYFAL